VLAYRSAGNRDAVDRLRELGVPTVELATDRLEDLAPSVTLLGVATGREAAADSLLAVLQADLAAATATRVRPPTVFILTWTQPAITLGAGSFLSEIVERAGAMNLFGDDARPSFVVSIETVVARDPDFVLVIGADEPGWLERPEWQVVPAVRARRLLRVSGSEFNRPSPRAPGAVAQLARSIDSQWP
jgi:ABC-type Fe3+-hydroxamate transport system substrate-binding protein